MRAIITYLIFSTGLAYGSEIFSTYIFVRPQIEVQTRREDDTITWKDVDLAYEVPRIDPAKFEILDAQFSVSAIIYAHAWGYKRWGVYVGYQFDDKAFWEGEGESSQLIGNGYGYGDYLGSEPYILRGSENPSQFYTGSPLVYHLTLSARAEGGVDGGGRIKITIPTATMYFKLRKIDPDAERPPGIVGPETPGPIERVVFPIWIGRPHPTDKVGYELKAHWEFPSPKVVNGTLWGFSGFRYTLMRGTDLGSGSPLKFLDGANALLSLSHDDSQSPDNRAFFWIVENKIQ